MTKLFEYLKKFCPHLLVVLIVFISYGQTLRMYFWQDDSALIFKLQNPAPAAGSFGMGVVGDGAYKYVVTPFILFYQFFGLNPFGYFLGGFITYMVATFFFWRFVKKLLSDSRKAYWATIIFAAGYIGSEIMFRVINSWQTNIGLTLTFLLFETYTKFLKGKEAKKFVFGNVKNYLLALLLYYLNTEFVFIRSHSLILPLIFLDFILTQIPLKINKFYKIILRQIPFLIVFKIKYLSDANFGGPGISTFFKDIFINRKYEVLSSLFANIGNGIFPTAIQSRFISFATKYFLGRFDLDTQVIFINVLVTIIFAFIFIRLFKKKIMSIILLVLTMFINIYFYNLSLIWYRDIQSVTAGLIGIDSIILVIFLQDPYVLFAFVFLVSQIFGYYLQYPTAVFHSTHRYFSYSLIGYSIFYAVLLSKRRNLLMFVVLANLFLGVSYQSKILSVRSEPSRQFYKSLKTYVPNTEKGTTFYFDVKQSQPYQTQFGDFFSVGSMPETTALAIYYGIDRYDVEMITDFNELFSKLSMRKIDVNRLYTFYYGENGLVDTTQETRELLLNGSIFQNTIKPFTPGLLELTLVLTPKLDETKFSTSYFTTDKKSLMLDYLISRKNYYKSVKVESTSEWKYREIRNIFDNDPTTPWQGHRIRWDENKKEEIIIDLGSNKNIAGLLWQNWNESLSPTSYNIYISPDKINWKIMGKVDAIVRKNGQVVFDEFPSAETRYIKMEITKTNLTDSPAILEIEPIEEKFKDVEFELARKVIDDPMLIISNIDDWEKLKSKLGVLSKLYVSWAPKVHTDVVLDAQRHTYEIIVPAGGNSLRELQLWTNLPAEIRMISARIRNISLSEMESRKLIQVFKEN